MSAYRFVPVTVPEPTAPRTSLVRRALSALRRNKKVTTLTLIFTALVVTMGLTGVIIFLFILPLFGVTGSYRSYRRYRRPVRVTVTNPPRAPRNPYDGV